MFETVATIKILSEEPIPDGVSIGWVIRECDDGDYVMADQEWTQTALTNEQMAQKLEEAGSDPAFFMLD